METDGRLEVKNSAVHKIRNAARAVHADGGSTVYLENVSFEDNHVGLYLRGIKTDNSGNEDPNLEKFLNLTFMYDLYGSGLLAGSVDQDLLAMTGAAADRPFAGVMVQACQMMNLTPTLQFPYLSNQYLNLPNGIVANNSNVIIGKSEFKGLRELSGVSAPTGYAVYSKSNGAHQLTVKGDDAQNPITIEDATYGIRGISLVDVDVQYVDFSYIDHGVVTSGISAQTTVNVRDCNLAYVAEYGLRHSGQGTVNYVNNDIEVDDYDDPTASKGYGILSSPVLSQWQHTVNVTENRIDLTTGLYGMEFYRHRGNVDQNTIRILQGSIDDKYGMAHFNPFNASISCNVVEGTSSYGSVTGKYEGIMVFSASDVSILCNALNYTHTGMRMMHMSDGVVIRANEYDDHVLGLGYGFPFAGNSTYVSPQDWRGNWWPSLNNAASPTGFGAIHFASVSAPVFQSRYRVYSAPNDEFLPKWTAATTWFLDQQGDNEDCEEDETPICIEGPGAPRNLLPDGLDEWIMEDSLEYASWQYIGDRRIMRRIASNPDMLLNGDFDDFYTDALFSDAGPWHEIDQDIRNAWRVEPATQTQLDDYREDLYQAIADIIQASDDLANATDSTDSLNLQGLLEAAIADYRIIYADWLVIADSVDQLAISRLGDIRTDNNGLTATEVWEENEQDVNQVSLTLVIEGRDTLTGTERTLLMAIADQCPSVGGDGVWHARAILRSMGEHSWDDADLCDDAEERYADDQRAVPGIRITPMPASDQLHLWSDMLPGSTLYMVDAYGRPVLKDTYSGDGHLLTVSHLAPGMYFLRLQNPNGEIAVNHVMISR